MPRSKSRTARTSARRRRPTASRPRKQRGGSRTVLPISYFGGDDSAAYTGKCGRSPIQTAYGGSVPTSFGELGTSLGADFAGPSLAPGSGVDGVSASALQTGGARRRRKSARRKSAHRRPTRRSRACRSHRTRTQRGGGQYGRTVMPIKYFGGDDSKAYSAPCGRTSFNTSYGRSVPTSFGGSAPELGGGFRGPNLAPGGMGEAFAVTGIQTGGSPGLFRSSRNVPDPDELYNNNMSTVDIFRPGSHPGSHRVSDNEFLLVRTDIPSTVRASISAAFTSINTTGVIRTTAKRLIEKDPRFGQSDTLPTTVPYYSFDKVYSKAVVHIQGNNTLTLYDSYQAKTSSTIELYYTEEKSVLFNVLTNSLPDTVEQAQIKSTKQTDHGKRTLYKIYVEANKTYYKLKTYSDFALLWQQLRLAHNHLKTTSNADPKFEQECRDANNISSIIEKYPMSAVGRNSDSRTEYFNGLIRAMISKAQHTLIIKQLLSAFLQEDDGMFFALNPKESIMKDKLGNPIPNNVIRVMRGGTVYFYEYQMDYNGYDDLGESQRFTNASLLKNDELKLTTRDKTHSLWLHLDLPAQERLFQKPKLTRDGKNTRIPLTDESLVLYKDPKYDVLVESVIDEKDWDTSLLGETKKLQLGVTVNKKDSKFKIAHQDTPLSYQKLWFKSRRLLPI